MNRALTRVAIVLLVFYRRYISPLKPPICRFIPTCSTYALEAVQVHGVLRGGALATWRLCRCHPWGGHGYDPVPKPPSTSDAAQVTTIAPVTPATPITDC